MHVLVHAALIEDRDGGVMVMATLFGLHPLSVKLYADGGYQGPGFQKGLQKAITKVNAEIRQAIRSRQGLRRAAQAMDRRAHLRSARSMPKARQGLGVPQCQGACLPETRLHPPYDQKNMLFLMKFADRLLDYTNSALRAHRSGPARGADQGGHCSCG